MWENLFSCHWCYLINYNKKNNTNFLIHIYLYIIYPWIWHIKYNTFLLNNEYNVLCIIIFIRLFNLLIFRLLFLIWIFTYKKQRLTTMIASCEALVFLFLLSFHTFFVKVVTNTLKNNFESLFYIVAKLGDIFSCVFSLLLSLTSHINECGIKYERWIKGRRHK